MDPGAGAGKTMRVRKGLVTAALPGWGKARGCGEDRLGFHATRINLISAYACSRDCQATRCASSSSGLKVSWSHRLMTECPLSRAHCCHIPVSFVIKILLWTFITIDGVQFMALDRSRSRSRSRSVAQRIKPASSGQNGTGKRMRGHEG